MTVLDTLAALARGEMPATGVLHNCRFENLGSETYGIEAIVVRLRPAAFAITPGATIVQTPRHVAVFDGDRAIFADIFDGGIGRLWLLGPGAGNETEAGPETGPEASIAVPFDPDLDQSGGDVFLAAGDNPALAPDAVPRVAALGHAITCAADGLRTRAFVIRAFGTAAGGAALFAVFRLRPDHGDAAGFTLTAAHWAGADAHFIRDAGGEAVLTRRRWTPRIASSDHRP